MARTKIVTDSACDLSPELASSCDIAVVPLSIRFGDKEYVDRVELTPEQFWALCKSHAELPETSAPSPGAFQQAFLDAKAAGYDGVVCICLSAALSGTYQSALAAKEGVSGEIDVHVVDSQAVTMAEGLMAMAAAEAAAQGLDAASIAELARASVPRTHVLGVLDTLEHLVKGGRVGGAKAAIGSLLSIKPLLHLKDGVVEEESKQRTRGRAVRYLVDKIRAEAPFERVAVVHGDASDLQELVSALEGIDLGAELLVCDMGPVVGTHGGPGIMGVCWQSPASR